VSQLAVISLIQTAYVFIVAHAQSTLASYTQEISERNAVEIEKKARVNGFVYSANTPQCNGIMCWQKWVKRSIMPDEDITALISLPRHQMAKSLVMIAIILAPLVANAQQITNVYKERTYKEMCWYLGKQNHPWIERANCTITDIQDSKGWTIKRTIAARLNSGGKQIVYRVVEKDGKTFDSDCGCWYKNRYAIATPTEGVLREAQLPSSRSITEVTKALWVRSISWD
jgi:hypothetical protein